MDSFRSYCIIKKVVFSQYQSTGFLHEDITLAYSVFLEELLSGLFSVIGLFGNSDFLDNVRREKISLYKNHFE